MLNNMKRLVAQGPKKVRVVAMLAATAFGAAHGFAQVKNGDFAFPKVTEPAGLKMAPAAEVRSWTTNDSKGQIEIWRNGGQHMGKVFNGPTAQLPQFAEVNANSHGTLTQKVSGIPKGSQYGFAFWHRGRHSEVEADSIEVTVQDGATTWKKVYSTTSFEWKNYAATVGTKTSDGDVILSFTAKATASNDPSIGNFLTGVQLDTSVKPPTCAANAAGNYKWTTDNTQTKQGNGKLEQLGTATLRPDSSAVHNGRQGVWQLTSNCQVVINWQNSKFVDILDLSADGKTLSGKNQIGTIITGKK
jgi:hypothetical protein